MINTVEYLRRLNEAVAFLRGRLGKAPRTVLVLGSGLGDFVEDLGRVESLAYDQIPHFPQPSAPGHPGKLVRAARGGRKFCVLGGRVHFYEGYSLQDVVFSVRVLALWGANIFVVTNSAGGINPEFQVGDLMFIRDHINLMGANPLAGPNLDSLGQRFPDMSEAYDRDLLKVARKSGTELNLLLREGVYLAVSGPSYETPAEITMCRQLGADAIGMSTVPEVIALKQMGARILGISCIVNMAAGILPQKLAHDKVLEVTARLKEPFGNFMLNLIERI